MRPVAPKTVSCMIASSFTSSRVAQHQPHDEDDDQHEHDREDDAGDDEMQRFAAAEVALAIRAALHAERGGGGAAGDLPERQRSCRRVGVLSRLFGHACALVVGSFSMRVSQ